MKSVSCAVRTGALLAAIVSVAAEPEAPPRPRPIHPDSAAMQKGLTDALLAFVVADGPAIRKALDVVEENCRRLGPADESGYPATIVRWDTAFHGDLDAIRELAARGILDKAYDRYTFLPRGCQGCHAEAAKAKLPGLPDPRR
jgi:hypothetical protein